MVVCQRVKQTACLAFLLAFTIWISGCSGVVPTSGVTPLAVPTGLAAAPGNTQIILTWNANPGATSYHVKRSSTTGGPYAQISAPASASFTDTGLVNGTTYYYVVSALDPAGEGANSAQANAMPTAQVAAPTAPTGLTATPANIQISLAWTATSGATSYHVKRSTTSGGPYTQVSAPATTNFTDTGLTNGTTYYYVVSALDSAGEGPNSTQASATPTTAVAPPAAPTGLTATPGSTQISLAWTATSGATSYHVKRSTTNGGPYTQVGAPTSTSFSDTGLTNGTTYYYVASGLDSAGEGSNSAQANATPAAGAATYSLNVVNGTGGGSYTAGSTVTITANAPPSGEAFTDWTGTTVQTATAPTTTLVMPASQVTVTANFATPPAQGSIPYPVSAHPRLWVTQSDVSRLQNWTTGSNQAYQQGMVPVLANAVNMYTTQFFPGGVANPTWPDPGDTQGYEANDLDLTEETGMVLAFNSLIDPSPANRITYAQDARNLIMYVMNIAVLPDASGVPFRDPLFMTYNRASATGEQWPLIVDWLYNQVDGSGNPILSASDKLTIRNVFLKWESDCLTASTTGGDSPQIPGLTNNLQLLPNNLPYRMAANNYYLAHARNMTMMALAIDPSDDPPVNGSLSSTTLGNTLRSYILDVTGAWLYQEFAMFGEPSTIASAYGLPTAGLGLASGGLPPEGVLYGESFGYIQGELLALQNSGFNDQTLSGPQIQLIGSPVWDRYMVGMPSQMVPSAQVVAPDQYLGPIYEQASYGDMLRLWVTPDYMKAITLKTMLDSERGITNDLNTARWFAVNALEGGAAALITRMTNNSYGQINTLLYFLLLDPTAAAATDPRPTFPPVFYDQPAGRIVAHSDWSPTSTMFAYRSSWTSINHQHGDAGSFEFYRESEWLTKQMSNYDNNGYGVTSGYNNSLSLMNWCANGIPSNLQFFETQEWPGGSQWFLGLNAGDPVNLESSGTGYVFESSDMTNLYNRPAPNAPSDAALDITQATRSILWLNNDYIVIYDRATSMHSGLFKRWNLNLITNPTISGHTAVETEADGQQLFVQTLLPANITSSAALTAPNLSPIAQLEPSQYTLTIQDPSNPTDTRFLNVLQGADSGAAMVPALHVVSTSGTAFDGAAFGSTVVFFPVTANPQLVTTAFSIPAGVHTALITGLTPNTSYGASAGGGTITITPGNTGATTDSAGVLVLTF